VVQQTSYITLVAHAIIGSVQSMIVAIGGLIFGYSEFLLLFVITFFTSLIPVIGASPVAIVLAVISLAQGEIKSAIGLAVVAIIAGSIDNILKPYIVSQSGDEELNPVIALIAIIGAVIVYGLPGLLLGPILTTLAFKIVPILFENDENSQT
jgi:predicted PurR-regulated permease PerM